MSGDKKRAAGNPLSAGGSQGPLLLPKAEDISNLGHDFAGCKFAAIYCDEEEFAAFADILLWAKTSVYFRFGAITAAVKAAPSRPAGAAIRPTIAAGAAHGRNSQPARQWSFAPLARDALPSPAAVTSRARP